MSQLWIEPLTDNAGSKYWLLFSHGQFHAPVAVIDDVNMRANAEKVAGKPQQIDDLGIAVKAYRKRHKMTQQEFADRSGISRNRISTIERGLVENMETTTIHKITMALAD